MSTRAAVRAPTGDGWALRWLLLLIVVTGIARLVLASTIGLGIDESYTVATARTWALATFDHPPLAWWLAHGAATLSGTEAPLAVRLPFILLSALSTYLAFDATRYLYSARAGLFAAVALNLAPVLAWTSGSMVLPDGPLLAAMLAGLCCLARALFGDLRAAPVWWLLAGLATGLACLSKLHGAVLLAGTGLFILTSSAHRHWLRSPWPYLAALVTLALFSPVLIWNAEHDWISFAFQAGRARSSRLNLTGPFVALGGQAAFLLPWVWVALMISLGRAAWAGPQRARDWLLFCLAVLPIAVFTLITLGGTRTLFHWAAPGYLFGCVLLGRDLARDLADGDRTARLWLVGSALSLVLLFASVIALARLPWPTLTLPGGKPVPYPLIETQSWRPLHEALASRGLLSRPNTFAAGLKWHEAARIDTALARALPVRCLCTDPRGYGILYDNRALLGQDAIVAGPALSETDARAALGPYFNTIERLAPVEILHAGQPLLTLNLYLGQVLRDPGIIPNLLAPLVRHF